MRTAHAFYEAFPIPFLVIRTNGYAAIVLTRIDAYRRRSLVLVAAIGLVHIMSLQF